MNSAQFTSTGDQEAFGRGSSATRRALGEASGRYSVFAELACGGMAMVYLGQREADHGFKRSIAIKRMHAQYARDPEFREMFLDEARLVAKIRHPNVVPTLDIVSREDALLLVMEYVEGESVAQLLSTSGKVPPRIAAAIAQDALCGLHAAHEVADGDGKTLGVIHRDVSPANVLVGVDGLSRILDFGVAKAAGRSASTRDGSIKGKIPYMPPEQLWGSELDRTVDTYALSVVLWEMLTGRRLFRGETDAETMKRVVEDEVEPPSTLSAEARVLDEVVMRGLSRDPSKRFQTAMEMAKAIDRALTPASRLEIGEWVGTVAKPALARRGELLRAMQRGEPSPVPQEAAAVVTALTAAPQTAAGVSFARHPSAPRPGPVRRSLGVIAASVALIAAATVTLAARPLADRIRSANASEIAQTPVQMQAPAQTPQAAAPLPASAATTAESAAALPPSGSLTATASTGSAAPAPKKGRAGPRSGPRSTARPAVATAASPAPEAPPGAMPAPVPGAALGSRY
jgi:serine/threonine-protein kinase